MVDNVMLFGPQALRSFHLSDELLERMMEKEGIANSDQIKCLFRQVVKVSGGYCWEKRMRY